MEPVEVEPGEHALIEHGGNGVSITELSYVGEEEVECVTAQLWEQSARDAEAASEERRRKEEVNGYLIRQGMVPMPGGVEARGGSAGRDVCRPRLQRGLRSRLAAQAQRLRRTITGAT